MASDTNYQVVRKFNGHSVGQVVPASTFASPHRVAQLISQRYLVPASSAQVQPTVATLLGATARKLSDLMPQVQDACVLEVALQQETREAARNALEKRLQEMTHAESTH